MACLLDQSITPEQHFKLMSGLKTNGWLDYRKLQHLHQTDPDRLQRELRVVLSRYRFPNKATKAISINMEKIERDYEGNLHNLYFSSLKDLSEVWKKVNELYWFGTKKAAVFVRKLVDHGLWELPMEEIPIPPDSRVRRVLWRMGLVKDRNDLKRVIDTARVLAKKVGVASLDLDCVLWVVGDERICGERKASCGKCPLEEFCPKVLTGATERAHRRCLREI